jgi:transcriptional regulator with XRE-family HTH domain
MSDGKKVLGARIKELREHLELRQADVSSRLRGSGLTKGFSTQHLSAVERGEAWPSSEVVAALDDLFSTGTELVGLLRQAKVPSRVPVSDRIGVTAHLFYPLRVNGLSTEPPVAAEPASDFVDRLQTKSIEDGATLHRFPFGVVVLHERHEVKRNSLAEIAEWRDTQVQRCPAAVDDFMNRHGVTLVAADHAPYCFAAFVVNEVPWEESVQRQRASHLLCMPRVLLASDDPDAWSDHLLNSQDPIEDVVDHSLQGSHVGGASWAGLTLLNAGSPIDLEPALVDLEVQLQAFWCYASNTAEDACFWDDRYGQEFLHRVLAKLERPWPTESTAVRRLREAIFSTSRIERLVRSAIRATTKP